MTAIPETTKHFTVTTDSQADWAIEKIAEAKAEYERLVAVCDERIAQFEARKQDAEAAYTQTLSYMSGLLSDYFDTVPHKTTKTQETYALPSGKLVFKRPAKKPVKDDSALLEWVKANAPEYVETTEKTRWNDLKKRLMESNGRYIDMETGEVVDGVRAEEEPGKFEVKING